MQLVSLIKAVYHLKNQVFHSLLIYIFQLNPPTCNLNFDSVQTSILQEKTVILESYLNLFNF